VKVAVPRNLTSSQKELLKQFAASVGDEIPESHGGGIFGKKKK
jgi:DnaJ-class molecular chaperone